MPTPRAALHSLAIGTLVAGAAIAARAAAAERVVAIPTRADVTVHAIVIDQAPADAPVVVLLMGGDGVMGLGGWDGRGHPSGNFLVRSRALFARQGLHVVVPDAPSDVVEGHGGSLRGFRTSSRYAADMKAIVDVMRARGRSGRAFLVGTSRGTIGAVGAAARLAPGTLAGIVLTATVTRPNRRRTRDTVHNADLAAVRVPVLLAHHEEDACTVTPAADLGALAKAFAAAPSVKTLLYRGGGPFTGDDCGARAAHGFPGLEERVVADIARWIKAIAGSGPAPR
jgi:hypothetical protein